jgi:hypothetical protein
MSLADGLQHLGYAARVSLANSVFTRHTAYNKHDTGWAKFCVCVAVHLRYSGVITSEQPSVWGRGHPGGCTFIRKI